MALHLRSGYLTEAYESEATLVGNAERALSDVDYDTLIGTGLSGSLVIPMLARKLGKHWLLVRKPRDGSHSSMTVEGDLGHRWVFVDDFISTGSTKRRVIAEVTEQAGRRDHPCVHVGDYLYQFSGSFHPSDAV